MRRSTQVIAPLLASAAAALLTSCHSGPEMQRCVDQQNRVVDPSFCKNLPQPNAQGTQQPLVPYISPYRFYYGGYGGYGLGSYVGGGGYVPSSGHSYSVTSGTSRGGFGSSFSGGEGGGE
jgi:hypothetical protein